MHHILLLITDLRIGGTPTVVRELATRLHEPGRIEVEVACLSPWGPVADELRARGIAVTAFGATSTAAIAPVVARLVRLARQRHIDTVFSFLIHANTVAGAASAMLPGVRFIQSIQTTQPEPRWHWSLQRVIRVAAERIAVPSPSAARAAREWSGVPAEQIDIIPNAVDATSFAEIYAFQVARPASSPVRIGFIGRFDPIKRVPEFLDAVASLPGCHVDLYGEGADRRRIESAIDRLHLADRVKLHGAIARPHEALAGMDVLMLPSRAEGFGLVLIEAMAAGVPVVAADVPGVRDVVDRDRTGLLVDDLTGDSIGRAIATATDPVRRAELIRFARVDVEQRFGWEAVMQKYRRLLRVE